MKRRVLTFVVSLMVAGFAVPAFAVDFLVGAKTGYYVWQPYFKDMKGSGVEELETGSGVLYGPTLGVILTDDISFSAVALYGTQSTYWDNENTVKPFGPQTIISTGNFYSEIRRVDLDSAFSYRVSESFKVFLGYKYQYTETTVRGSFLSTDPALPNNDRFQVLDAVIQVPAHGPALGIGYSRTIESNFFISMNLSGLYLFSRHKFAEDQIKTYEVTGAAQIDLQSTNEGATGRTYATQQMGLNAEPAVGIVVGNVVATLGVRFQWVRIRFIDKPMIDTVQFGPTGWMNDYLYGVFVGAMYRL